MSKLNEGAVCTVQIERPGESFTMPQARSLLEPAGIHLDEQYGLIPVNPSQGRYVVRGKATPEAIETAQKIPGVTVYPELQFTEA